MKIKRARLSDFEKWLHTEDGRSCNNWECLALPKNNVPFAQNRLEVAFWAGIAAAERSFKRIEARAKEASPQQDR
jgi:hypothetical protein